MAAGDIDIGRGAAITFGTNGAGTYNALFSATLRGLRIGGINRPAIDKTVMATTTARVFLEHDLYDAGSISCDVMLKTTGAYTSGATNLITTTAEVITVTFSDAETWSASGFCTDQDFDIPLDDVMTGTITFKLTGALTN